MAFCPDSSTALAQVVDDVSSAPPTEWIELAVESLRVPGRCGLRDGLLHSVSTVTLYARRTKSPLSYLWNGNSPRVAEEVEGERLSTDTRAPVLEYIGPPPQGDRAE